MRQQKAKKSHRWMPLIILAISVISIVCLIFLFYLYNTISEGKEIGFDQIKKYILSNTELVHINTIESFYEKDTYHIIFGETEDEKQKIIFMPFSENESDLELITIDHSEIISREQILQQLKDQCQNCKALKVKPAIINQNPLWEITYRDGHNRYIFDYFSIYDGSRYERLQLKQLFK